MIYRFRTYSIAARSPFQTRSGVSGSSWNHTPVALCTAFTSAGAYSRAKLAQMLFALELDRRMRSAEAPAISLAAHPGGTRTGVMREQSRFLQWAYHASSLRWLTDRFIMDPPDGALSVLRAGTDPKAQGGEYYGPVGGFGLAGPPVLVEPSAKAKDRDVAARLWDIGAELTGVTIDLG